MSVKVTEFVTKEDYQFQEDAWHQKLLPVGTFVKPIHIYYLPEHIKQTSAYKWFDSDKEIFVYCSYGILVVPKTLIREA